MSNIVTEYWEVDGVSLHTWAWAIETLNGREGLPPRRGDNEIVAYRRGEVWRPKVFGARQLSLVMWVKGSDANGIIPGAGARAQFRSNLESLKSMFGVIDRELVLTRRIQTLASLLVQTGKAECVGTIEPNMRGKTLAGFVADLLMADPFWYGAPVVTAVPVAGATVTNVGTAPVRKMVIRLNGPLTNPQLVNQSTSPVTALSYIGVIAGGNWVDLDTDNYTARDQTGASVIGNITHSGDRSWMQLLPGGNAMLLNVGAGAGNASISYSPAYL